MSRPKGQEKMVQISISLPRSVLEWIEQQAAADNRNRSNYLLNTFRKICAEKLNGGK